MIDQSGFPIVDASPLICKNCGLFVFRSRALFQADFDGVHSFCNAECATRYYESQYEMARDTCAQCGDRITNSLMRCQLAIHGEPFYFCSPDHAQTFYDAENERIRNTTITVMPL